MAKDPNFTEQLKKGMVLEDIAVDHLLDNNPGSLVIPTHDFKTGKGKGPRMLRKGHKDVIFPDLMMVEAMSKAVTLIEVKRKKKTLGLPGHHGKEFAAVEKYKVQDYRKCANLLGADLYFIIGIDSSGELHYVKDSNHVIHNFNNQYSRCDNYCIELTDKTIVDKY